MEKIDAVSIPCKNAAAERRGGGELVIDVQRIHVARDLDESPQVVLGERLREGGVLADFEVVDARGFSWHG